MLEGVGNALSCMYVCKLDLSVAWYYNQFHDLKSYISFKFCNLK